MTSQAQLFGSSTNLLDAEDGVFGPIPNLLDGSFSSPREGSWSIRPFGRLGNGYRPQGGTVRPARSQGSSGIFGRIPHDYAQGAFGEIPNLLDAQRR